MKAPTARGKWILAPGESTGRSHRPSGGGRRGRAQAPFGRVFQASTIWRIVSSRLTLMSHWG